MPTRLKEKKIIQLAEKTLSNFQLCDHCIGRVFAKIEHGLTNKERGEIVRGHLEKVDNIEVDNCWLCFGLLGEIQHFADLVSISLNDIEFGTFLDGSKVDEDILERERNVLDFAGSEFAEPIKMELNREIGKVLERGLGKEVDFETPDIMAIIDTSFDEVTLQIKSLFVYGRYRK